jgi:serine/threonine protein kinase
MPTSLSAFSDGYAKRKMAMPVFYVKLSIYQMFRALAYLHGRGICHRDIKPQNLLLNVSQGILKLCDFGCAKGLQPDAPNVSYICSRYYRAPELCLGASYYTHAIDVWSGACVMAELLINRPIFRGAKSTDQMEKIMRVLGPPSRSEIRHMNPEFRKELTTQSVHNLDELLKSRPLSERAEEIDFLKSCFHYVPSKRPHAIETLLHPFFNELRQSGTVLPNGQPLPPLFDFSQEELALAPGIESRLRPK